MRYFIYKDGLDNKLLWCCGFCGEEVEVSKRQYYFLVICGFLGYKNEFKWSDRWS